MLCKDVKRVIYFFLDGSIDGDRSRDLSDHLKLCPECDTRSQIHKRIRSFVKRRLDVVPAPQHLRTRLTRSIRAFRTEWQS